MLTDVPFAEQYELMPISEPSVHIPVGDLRVCGITPPNKAPLTFSQLLMDFIGKVVEDKDVVAYGGVSGGRMMIMVNITKEVCYEVIDGAMIAVGKLFEGNPDIMPAGGVGYEVRDWDKIPDSEKAGSKKK